MAVRRLKVALDLPSRGSPRGIRSTGSVPRLPSRGDDERSRRQSAPRRHASHSDDRPSTGSSAGCVPWRSARSDTAEGAIPIVAVNGTNGKSTTTRLIAHIASSAGRKVGMTNSDGIYVRVSSSRRGIGPLRRCVAGLSESGPTCGCSRRPAAASCCAARLRGQRLERVTNVSAATSAAGDRHRRRAGRGEGTIVRHHEARRLGRPQRGRRPAWICGVGRARTCTPQHGSGCRTGSSARSIAAASGGARDGVIVLRGAGRRPPDSARRRAAGDGGGLYATTSPTRSPRPPHAMPRHLRPSHRTRAALLRF